MNFENKGKWLKEAIDDDSDSIFSDEPLDEIDEDEEKVFVRNMSTGNSYYINQSNFDKDKHELIDDSQQSSTDITSTSLAFEVHDLQVQQKRLEQQAKSYKTMHDDAMKAIDYPHTNFEQVQRNRDKAEKANELYTLALHKLNSVKAELHKKQGALNKIKGENK